MAYVKKIFSENFLYYASYVIKDRAIPDLDDGLKPVQRRILHTLFEVDDGKYHKVANIVGHCMKYHPHGDASIYSALVVLANKELFIDKQGNFGNIYTGDEASAARYIECRVTPFAKEILYNSKITQYEESYDGRNHEPVAFPAKLPLVVITGADGIAVGMSTKILPHNPVEVIEAEIAALSGLPFALYPDFPTGGLADIAEYEDGIGKVRVRATLDSSDPKRLVVRDLPYGVTTESLIESVEAAAKKGRIKIASISDFTTDKVEIEIKLARGEYSGDTVDALFAFTQCEQSISCNLLVIKDGTPTIMTVSEVVRYHAKHLLKIMKAELDVSVKELLDDIHARTLERIFIEERVYKQIENKKTQEGVFKAVLEGLAQFASEIKRDLSQDDVERLLKIPIRRISLYDIEKAKKEMEILKGKLKEARYNLAHLTDYGIAFLTRIAAGLKSSWKRKTRLLSFGKVDVKEAARRDIALRYDRQTGYLGSAVSSGELLFDVSPFDKLLVIRRTGMYAVLPLPDKLFVDREMAYCAVADKDALADVIFTVIYKDPKNGYPYIKRAQIEGWIMNKDYNLVPENAQLLFFTAEPSKKFLVRYIPKGRLKIAEETYKVSGFDVKGLKTNGIKIASREVKSVEALETGNLFDESPGIKNPAKKASGAKELPSARKAGAKSGGGKSAGGSGAAAKKSTAKKSSAAAADPKSATKAKPAGEPKSARKPGSSLLDKASVKKPKK